MHVFFSGIGGTGIGPLALIAHQAGYSVSGSDKQSSEYVEYLKHHGIVSIHIGQEYETIQNLHQRQPIDWLVYSSAVPKENPDHPELRFAKEQGITATKRDDFINKLLADTGQKMIAVAGTHGKTTTTAMTIWACKQLGVPISYSVGGKLSFGDMGEFDKTAEYFVYEADEYDRNFLSFSPVISLITGLAHDHPDIYPTPESYNEAFLQFIGQSEAVVMWEKDAHRIGAEKTDQVTILPTLFGVEHITLAGKVNRQNAFLVAVGLESIGLCTRMQALEVLNRFPGVARRFEMITDNVYSDYAHTPEKIRGALELAHEVAGDNVVVVYEGLHNTRQHFIRNELSDLFTGIKKVYVAPSYLAREDESLEMLTPEKLCEIIKDSVDAEPVKLDKSLREIITKHVEDSDLVLCLSAGGGGSLDEWLRKELHQ